MQSSAPTEGNVPRWRVLYEAAVLELDRGKLPQRIQEAQAAITSCLQDLEDGAAACDKESLMNALLVLRDLSNISSKDSASDAA